MQRVGPTESSQSDGEGGPGPELFLGDLRISLVNQGFPTSVSGYSGISLLLAKLWGRGFKYGHPQGLD